MSTVAAYECQHNWFDLPWNDLPWDKIQEKVWKLQTQIYRATREGDMAKARRLQRLLLSSTSPRFLAVRKVTQDNKGKRTAGIDGICSLTPKQRTELVKRLQTEQKTKPVRRVWIPKPDKQELRPLGIPTMEDRARQAFVFLALEPMWEAKFEANSYGFRPGRATWDAMSAIFLAIKQKSKYVLDADISKCFDRIDHTKLLQKLEVGRIIRWTVKGWLKAGVMDNEHLFPTKRGTPQGGVISPLLANIALHGLETTVHSAFPRAQRPCLIRYADDFVVLHSDLDVIQKSKQIIEDWLANIGLELNQEKTRIVHTLEKENNEVGFDFLGFTVRQFPVGKTHSGKNSQGKLLGFKTIITPSKRAIKRHLRSIGRILYAYRATSQEELIKRLNPIICGWASYYQTVVSKRTYTKLDAVLFQMLWAWAKRRHPNKGRGWIAHKYWLHSKEWRFSTKNGIELRKYCSQPIRRHVKVKGDGSPYNREYALYWAHRLQKYSPTVNKQKKRLLRKQNGQCQRCGKILRFGDIIETDHIIRGKGTFNNLQLLHRHCHHQKTAQERKWYQ